MKIALFGNGTMGQLVEACAVAAGHEIGTIITSRNKSNDESVVEKLVRHDVAIDFSVADAVLTNTQLCMRAGLPLVEGTTGWKAQETEVRRAVEESNGALVYGANFSIGVNVFYRLVEQATALISALEDYEPFIEEAHHARKRDAPSGTALKIRDLMSRHYHKEIPTSSTRAGFIPGTHRVGFDSSADEILLTHTARSRQGFAAGALLAANWLIGKQGVFEFADVIEARLDSAANRLS